MFQPKEAFELFILMSARALFGINENNTGSFETPQPKAENPYSQAITSPIATGALSFQLVTTFYSPLKNPST